MTRKHLGIRSVGRLPILALLLVAMVTATTKAQTLRDWNNPAGGSYTLFVNWLPNNVPDTISETANFSIAGTFDVTLNSGVTTVVSDLFVFNGDVTFNASGAASAIYEMDDDALITSDLTLMQAPGLGDVTLNVGDRMQIIGGGTVSVFQGSDVTAANLDLAISSSNGTMIVDGVGSSLVVSTLTQLGSGGATGTLTFQNGSTGNSLSGTVDLMANSVQAGSTGRLNVLSGSALQTGNINVGLSPSLSTIQEGTLTVDGVGSTLTMTGASALTVGDDINPNIVSDVIVSNSAVMSTGTGAILIQNSGHLDIQAGTFNANGNLTVDGGTITRGADSNGFNLSSGSILSAVNTAQINFGGDYSIDQGTTFSIQLGSDFDTTGALNIGDAGGNGTLVVDGAGSSLTTGGNTSFWGNFGNTADVTFRNGATGNLGLTHIAVSTTGGTTGILDVESGAVVTANTLTVAAGGGATTSGTITVDGSGSSLAQEGAFTLVVGHATEGTATINVQNGGTFSTGSETTTVNPTGTINVGVVGTGTLNVTSDLTVDGGTITRGSSSGGFNLTPGNTLTATNNGQINFGGGYNLDQGTTFDIQSGADFTTTDFLDIGSSGDGTLLVDGAGSSVTTGMGSYIWGNSGNTADVTFRNAAIGNLGEVFLANSSVGGTTGIFRVESGATVFANKLNVATFGGATTSGTVTVDGVGSSLTQNGASALTVGHATSGTATINVQNGGTFTTGTGLTTINNTGTVNVSTGGTFNLLGNILDLEGTINIQNGGVFNTDTGLTTVNTTGAGGTINIGVVGSSIFNANGNLTVDGGTITRGADSNGFNLSSGSILSAVNTAQINFGGDYSIDQGTTFSIQLGSDFDTTGALNIGDAGGNGTLVVDGAGSSLTTGGNTSFWGNFGNTADVTFRNGATGNLGLTHIAVSTTGGTTGILDVESGAVVTANTLTVAAGGGATTSGTITVDGSGSSLAEGAFTLVVGHATEGTATINVQNGGTFSTGSETTTVNPTGTINVGVVGTGTLNVTSDLTVDGGTITRGSSSGGFNLTPGNTLTATNNGQINFGGGYNLDQGTTFDIQSGADFTTTDFLDIGSSGDGTLLVDGAGSSVTTGMGSYIWGNSGNTADVTFRNAAIGNLGEVFLANSSVGGTTGIFRVESGATVFANKLNVATFGGATTSGTVTVDGVGSSLTQNGASALTVGHATSGTATINVQNGGTFTTGTGLTTINNTGTVNVSTGGTFNLLGNNLNLDGAINLLGGTLIAADPVVTGGSLNFVFGTVELNSNQVLDPQRLAELDAESLDTGKTLRVNGVATLLTPLPLAGGTFTTESLVNPFLLDFQSGTFELTSDDLVVGPAGLFGSPLTVATGQATKVTNTTTIESGATLVIESGGAFMAGTLANAGSVVLNGPAATLGGTTFSNDTGGVVRGKGTISAAFNNNVGGELRGESGNTLLFTGTPSANAGQINLQGGTVQFAQALTNSVGGQVTGRGTLNVGSAGLTNNGHIALSSGISDIFGDVSNDTGSASIGITVSGNADVTFWDDVQNSSGRFQVSGGSSATFFGAFAGNGITGTGDVFMEADITPGFSPGAQDFGGNVYFGPVASLEIEIAGIIVGSEFDQMKVASSVSLDGTLDVTFIDGFMPTAGDTFEIITAASVLGVFDTVSLPALPGDLLWFINYGATSVELVSTFGADFDEDGDVDGDDLSAWENGFGSTPATHMTGDTNANALATGFDFLTWQRQIGNGGGAPLAAVTTIPEPSSCCMLLMGLVAVSTMKRRGNRC